MNDAVVGDIPLRLRILKKAPRFTPAENRSLLAQQSRLARHPVLLMWFDKHTMLCI
jgi:hypothetical protein